MHTDQRLTNEAYDLFERLRHRYPEEDVKVARLGTTVTISRGRRAVQIFVKDASQFVVSVRMRQTFHMQAKQYGPDNLIELVDMIVGKTEAADMSDARS